MIQISLQSKSSRYETVYASLEALKQELVEKVKDKTKIVLKINFTDSKSTLGSTHPEAVRASLDFFKTITDQPVIIAEAPFRGSLNLALKNLGYREVLADYNVKYVDLNKDQTQKVSFEHPRFNKPKTLKFPQTILESDFLISLCPPKTHDVYIVTLGLKNIAVGSTITTSVGVGDYRAHYRAMYHLGKKRGNILLSLVCQRLYPDLNIIDGWQGMQGNGPVSGSPVDWRIAIAGTNALAVDRLTARLMGFDPDQIGYLYYLQQEMKVDESSIQIVGETDWQKFQREFKPHESFEKQLQWK